MSVVKERTTTVKGSVAEMVETASLEATKKILDAKPPKPKVKPHEHDWVVRPGPCCSRKLECAGCKKVTKSDGNDLYDRGLNLGDHVYLDKNGIAQLRRRKGE